MRRCLILYILKTVHTRKRRLYLITLLLSTCIISYLVCNRDDIPQWFVTDCNIPVLDPDTNYRLSKNRSSRNLPDSVYEGNIWVILDVENIPSTEEKKFCNNSKYTVLVIGIDLYKHDWRKTKCRFLDIMELKKLKFKSSFYLNKSLHSNAVRKNIAILFAIQQGASVIYNLKSISDFVYKPFAHKWCIRYSGSENLNPFHHFQIVKSGVRSDRLTYHLTECKQTVISLLPSLNLKTTASFPSNISRYINQAAPPISASRDSFLQFVPESQIFHRDSFWSSVTFPNVSMIAALFTSYWRQFLLHKVGQDLSVTPSVNTKYSVNSINVTDDTIYHQIFHSKACNGNICISQCAIQLATLLVKFKIWKPSHLDLIFAWFADLDRVNYSLPEFDSKLNESSLAVIGYSPKAVLHTETFTSICEQKVKVKTISQPITDILLLIVFNHPIYKHVGLLHEIYSRTFTNIVYCGEDIQQFQNATQYLDYNLTFIEQHVFKGYYIYKCVSSAMKIDYNVSGILMLSDDVLFNSWNVKDLPTDQPWTGQMYRLRRGERHSWYNWRQSFGEQAYTESRMEIIALQKQQNVANGKSEYKTDFVKLESRLNILGNSTKTVVFGIEDITYIPRKMFKDYIYYGDIFARHGLFLEIAIPVLVAGLTDREDILMIRGAYLWGQERVNYHNFYNTSQLFMHPFKWGIELNKDFGRKFLCEKYFPYL